MKIIQQDFKITSKFLCLLTFIFSIGLLYSFFENENNSFVKLLFNLITSIGGSILCAYGAYQFSFTYEFKQKELVVSSLFTFWIKENYEFRFLKKVETHIVSNTQGIIDEIHLYFEKCGKKKKIVISRYQIDMGKVKLFLFTNIDNFEQIIVEDS